MLFFSRYKKMIIQDVSYNCNLVKGVFRTFP